MHTIIILLDSLNFHCLEPYGASHVQTPNLRRFGERACVFDNHFIGSAPCMPARRELLTGRQEFLWRGWGHIEPWDRHLAARCRAGRRRHADDHRPLPLLGRRGAQLLRAVPWHRLHPRA